MHENQASRTQSLHNKPAISTNLVPVVGISKGFMSFTYLNDFTLHHNSYICFFYICKFYKNKHTQTFSHWVMITSAICCKQTTPYGSSL